MTKLIYASWLISRDEARRMRNNLYLFGDNKDRNSGHNPIPEGRPYCRKYGKGKHFPTMTSAVLRGLNNSMPVCTQHWYHGTLKGTNGRWTDEDFDEFKSVVDDEFEDIKNYIKENNPAYVVLPKNGFFNSKISDISIERVPKIFEYLKSKLDELDNFIANLS